jgi:hypothetical protein
MFIASLVAIILSAGQAPALKLTPADRAAAEAATQRYREAWLANDPRRIMATLTPDAVLYPSTLPAATLSVRSGSRPHPRRALSPWN